MKKKKCILEGHKKVGKRFIPPMMQIPKMSLKTTYVNDILPELVWIGLLNDSLGYIPSARIQEELFITANGIQNKELMQNLALISTYSSFTQEQKITLTDILNKKGILGKIQNAIAPLILLYNQCPISFFGPPENVYSKNELINRMKDCLRKTLNKYETPGIALYASMLMSRVVTKTIMFNSSMNLPDINSIFDSPNSEEAKLAAGFVRSSAMSEFGMLNLSPNWPKYFWNKNIQLSECEIINVKGDSDD
jgi:hypothetical protein